MVRLGRERFFHWLQFLLVQRVLAEDRYRSWRPGIPHGTVRSRCLLGAGREKYHRKNIRHRRTTPSRLVSRWLIRYITYWVLLCNLLTNPPLGGSWLTASLMLNDWPTPSTLVYGDHGGLPGWMLDLDLVAPSSINSGDSDNQAYWGSLLASVGAKANATMSVILSSRCSDVDTSSCSDTSFTDLWGRALSYHFLNQTTRDNFYTNNTGHGAGQLWSQIPLLPSYVNRSMPFPIITADSLPTNSTSVVSLDSVVYEASLRILSSFAHLADGSSSRRSSLVLGIQTYLLWLPLLIPVPIW